MMKIVAILVVLVALLGGAAAGHFLKPEPTEEELAEAKAQELAQEAEDAKLDPSAPEVVSFRDQFIVPVLRDGRVWSHVVLTLGVESRDVSRDDVLLREPILRDGMNEALFLHASLGGFDGDFTAVNSMNRLRTRLNEVVSGLLGDPNARALIISLARQNG